jgi:hypothetical protein
MTPEALKSRRLAGIFLLGWILFNYPIISLFNLPAFWRGIPLLYAYVFFTWAVIIALIMLVARRDRPPADAGV